MFIRIVLLALAVVAREPMSQERVGQNVLLDRKDRVCDAYVAGLGAVARRPIVSEKGLGRKSDRSGYDCVSQRPYVCFAGTCNGDPRINVLGTGWGERLTEVEMTVMLVLWESKH